MTARKPPPGQTSAQSGETRSPLRSRRRFIASGLSLCAAVVGLAIATADPPRNLLLTRVVVQIGSRTLELEHAITASQIAYGEMNRDRIELDGMFFDFGSVGRRCFWMKNTHIRLDMYFFGSDGTLQSSYRSVRADTLDRHCSNATRYVIETVPGAIQMGDLNHERILRIEKSGR